MATREPVPSATPLPLHGLSHGTGQHDDSPQHAKRIAMEEGVSPYSPSMGNRSAKTGHRPALMLAAIQAPGDSPASHALSPTSPATRSVVGPSAERPGSGPSSDPAMEELEQVTGDPGDVQRHPTMAYGECSLTFKDVAFAVKGKGGKEKVILSPLSGHFEPGTMVALMGPSGSGKTTLLDILADKKTAPYRGVIHVNGRPRDHLFRRTTTYVAQTDLMPPHLTVKEAVIFHTLLKTETPSKFTRDAIDSATEERLAAVGLCEVKDMRVGNETVRGISGGQRRRVSLACGLASGAQMFFCDEPTSGLSATDAEASVRFLRLVAKKFNVTMVVAIHQPRVEVARLFDHLLLLTASPGRAVYNGPMRAAAAYWESVGFPVPEYSNPTDYFLDLVTPGIPSEEVDLFVEHYRLHSQPAIDEMVDIELHRKGPTGLQLLEGRRQRMLQWGELPAVRDSVYGVRFRKQLGIVFQRQLKLCLRDAQGFVMEIIMAVAKALIVGVAYVGIAKQDAFSQIGFFFMVLMTCSLDGMKVMPKLIEERTIMKKETSDALYSDWAYIISFTIINGIVGFASNSLFLVLLFVLSGFGWNLFWSLFLWTTLLYFTMDSLYLMIAAIGKDSTSAQILALPFLMVFLLYNGFTVSKATVPIFMNWALWISPVAYAIEAVSVSAQQVASPERNYELAVETFKYTDQWQLAVCVMCACLVLFRTVQVVCLRMLNNPKR